MRLIFLELNEINFDLIKSYIQAGEDLPGFNKLFTQGIITTQAEDEYQNLEPWIQWPSVHTGKTFAEHKVFRLGDIVGSTNVQFFEKVEDAGFRVGAISPMNASNRLKCPEYFIPDPWTNTACDNNFFSRAITSAIVQAVNDNSQSKLTFKTIVNLGLAFFALVKPSRYFYLMRYALRSSGKPWKKALFLDLFLFEIHKTLFAKKNPNFSTLFLNAGAHIQHHYFFNSQFVKSAELKNPAWYIENDVDPFLEMLHIYDEILVEVLEIPDTELIIATGLSQQPYEQLTFYYRLRSSSFLKKVGIDFRQVEPRMTRDFLISFDDVAKSVRAEQLLSELRVDGNVKLFEEIDNRGKDLFVTLTYPSEITDSTTVTGADSNFFLSDFVAFVAIKNGEHRSKGYAYFSKGVRDYAPADGSHVSKLHHSVLQFFGVQS